MTTPTKAPAPRGPRVSARGRPRISARGRHCLRRRGRNANIHAWRPVMKRPDPAGPDIVSRALARNRLGVPSVVFFGVAGAAPLTVILGAVTTIYAVVGSTVVPVS